MATLSNFTITSPAGNDILIYSNGQWVNSNISAFWGVLDGRYAPSSHNHDGRYALIGDSYTKAETYPAASLYTRAQLYTKTEVDSLISGVSGGGSGGGVSGGQNVGGGSGNIYSSTSSGIISFRSLVSTDGSTSIATNGNTVDIKSTPKFVQAYSNGQDVPTGRSVLGSGIHTYNTRNGNTGQPGGGIYGSSIVWGKGTDGSVELWGGWVSGNWGTLWVRALRDTTNDWSGWYQVYTSREGVPWSALAGSPSGNYTFTGAVTFQQKVELPGGWMARNPADSTSNIQTNFGVSAPIAPVFSEATSDKKYISFSNPSGSNDAGYIMHETGTAGADTNKGVLHLCPSDDPSANDYIYVHGSNDNAGVIIDTNGGIRSHNKILDLQSTSDVYLNPTGNTRFKAGNVVIEQGHTYMQNGNSLYVVGGGMVRFQPTSQDEVRINASQGRLDVYNQTDSDFAEVRAKQLYISGTGYEAAQVGYRATSTTLNNNTTLPSGFFTTSDGSGIGLDSHWYHVINLHHGDDNGYNSQIAVDLTNSADFHWRSAMGGTWSDWYKVYHTGNTGPGSGLDADTVDGVHASSFARKPTNHESNNTEYNIVWENRNGTLYFSQSHFTYNPNQRRLTLAGKLVSGGISTSAPIEITRDGTDSIKINKTSGTQYSGVAFQTAWKTTWLLHTHNTGTEDLILQYRDPATGNFVGTSATFYNANGKVRLNKGLEVGGSGITTDSGAYTKLGGEITSSSAQLQVKGFSRMGDIYMHEDADISKGEYRWSIEGNNRMRLTEVRNNYGYMEFGMQDASWARIQTDMPNFYMDKALYNGNGYYVHATRSKLLPNNIEIGPNSNTYIRLDNNGELTHRNTGWANNSSETVIMRRSYTSLTGDFIQLHATGNGTTNGAMCIGRNMFAVGLSDYALPAGTSASPLNTDTWMAVDTTSVYLSGNTAIRHYDGYLRINDLGDFNSGVYFGGKPVRIDGVLRIGDSGEHFKADAISIDSNKAHNINADLYTNNSEIYVTTSGKGIRFKPSGSNDYGGIRYVSTGNDGYMEFWTSDDYSEPFVFRAYDSGDAGTGTFRDWMKVQGGNLKIFRAGDNEVNMDMHSGDYFARMYYRRADSKMGFFFPNAAGSYATRLSWDGSNDRWTASGEMWAVDMVATSDLRVKENLEVIDSAVAKVSKLTGYTYDHKETTDDRRRAGIVAQDLLKVLPEGVSEDEEGKLSVSPTATIALLVNAIKELSEELNTLKELVNG